MIWSRWYAFKSYFFSTVWCAPVVALLVEQAVFRLSFFYPDPGFIPGFEFTREGTMTIADYVISSSIAFMVFTFSSLLVAIQVASAQLTPRIIATTLLRNKPIRRSVALFTFSLLLAVAVKARVDTIPRHIVSLMGILGVLNVVTFMFLIDYAARLLRPVSIMWRIAQQGLRVIEEVYPLALTDSYRASNALQDLGPPDRTILHRGNSAIVIAINLRALMAMSKRSGCVIAFVPRVGDFVASGDPLFRLHGPGAETLDARSLRNHVAFGSERTIEQDSTFAFRVIVDIGLRALSKAINDPTTAVLAIDQLQRLLRTVGQRILHDERVLDEKGALRLVLPTPNWLDFVQLTCTELRHFGAEHIQVARRMRAMLESVLASLPERRRPELRRELDLLDRKLQSSFAFPEDQKLARLADTQGLGGASSLSS